MGSLRGLKERMSMMSKVIEVPSLKLTFSHLKMDGWKTSFLMLLLGIRPIFRGELLVLGSVSPLSIYQVGYPFIPFYFAHDPIRIVEEFDRRIDIS